MAHRLAFGTFGAVLLQATAQCCSCLKPPAVAQTFAEATAVFSGQCISGRYLSIGACEFTFRVEHAWKGAATNRKVTVHTGLGGADCGYPFRIGQAYIVYCFGSADSLATDICSRTCEYGSLPGGGEEAHALDEAAGRTRRHLTNRSSQP
jgi:hypothetical protein